MSTSKVYLIAPVQTVVVKIGKSVSPTRRLADLQTGSPDRLELLTSSAELEEVKLHREFKEYRRESSEYFDLPLPVAMRLFTRFQPSGCTCAASLASLTPVLDSINAQLAQLSLAKAVQPVSPDPDLIEAARNQLHRLYSLSVPELKAEARELGLTSLHNMSKLDLIKAIDSELTMNQIIDSCQADLDSSR